MQALKELLLEVDREVVDQILSETDGESLIPAFSSQYFTLFISDLPYSLARRCFEAFLLLGEKDFLTKLIIKAV
jgi:hypothetical protein